MRLAYAFVPLLAVAACQTAGDRSGTGQCPTGEVCSPKTPKGLDFRGPDYADDWIADATIKPTAVGGTQTITILNAQDQLDLAFPYTATLDSPALTAEAPNGPLLTLDGQASGSAMLRIKDAADGTLFDRVTVTATPVASADVVAFHDEELLASDPPPAILVGTHVQLLAQLWDASGVHRIVDESLVVAVTGQATQQTTWDTVSFTPNAIGTIGVTLHAAGAAQTVGSVVVVDSIDGLVPGYTSFGASNPPRANQSLVACIEAQRAGAPVVGLDWTMSITGADSSQPWVAKNCLAFTRSSAGTVTVHAIAGAASADFQIDVLAPQQLIYTPHDTITHGDYSSSFL
jgi:hypothetical protein